MEAVVQWVSDHWLSTVGILYILDKITKLTPTPYDDFVVDALKDFFKIATGRKKADAEG